MSFTHERHSLKLWKYYAALGFVKRILRGIVISHTFRQMQSTNPAMREEPPFLHPQGWSKKSY
jgi:hypothetical protein